MGKYLKLFENHSQYETFIGGGGDTPFIKPNVSYCIEENEVHYNPWTYADAYLTFVAKESGTFTFTPQSDNVISHSTDGGENWIEGNSVTVSNGDKVMWKGEMTPFMNEDDEPFGIGSFSSTGRFDVQGNIMSLLYGDNFKGQTDLTGKDGAFQTLFMSYGNTNVVNAENLILPATTLASSCYANMFQGCTSLTTAPELPATTLARSCYENMFAGCTNLTTAPELPATTLARSCYAGMFRDTNVLPDTRNIDFTSEQVVASGGLSGLFFGTKVTDNDLMRILPKNNNGKYCLPATTLTTDCYNSMFRDCTNLTTAPELPATTLASYCYNTMFKGCTSLTTAPQLPATTLASSCYSDMFYGCTSLTTAPELPATTLERNCYANMFRGCTSLNYIKAMFTTTPSTKYTQNWVNGVASTGTFVKNSAAKWDVTGVNGIPSGWTVVTE